MMLASFLAGFSLGMAVTACWARRWVRLIREEMLRELRAWDKEGADV